MIVLLAALVYTIKVSAVLHASAGGPMPSGASYDRSIGTNGAAYMPTFDANGSSGTLTLDVVQANNADGSTVFKLVQTGFNDGKPFMCAAYGETGNVVCDADHAPPAGTLLFLRIAGSDFYSPARLDANKHWRIISTGRTLNETADFTVTKTAGTLLTIAMKRHGTQSQPPLESRIEGTVTYDTARGLPTALDAVFTLMPQGAGAQPSQARVDIQLQH